MSWKESVGHIAANPEEELLLRRIADKAEQCRRQNIPVWTRFLTEREQDIVSLLLPMLGSPAHAMLGAPGGERKVLYFLPDWMEEAPEEESSPIACVRCSYAAEYGAVGHRDLLGALMGLGVERDTVGDLLIGEGSADLVLLRDILPFVLQNLTSAGRVHLSLSEIPFSALSVPQEKTVLVRDTVASLRLDSVLGSGFGMAREKAVTLIRSGRVQVDHLDCLKPDKMLAQGAVITARGFGKLELTEVGGLSKKGRTGIVIKKYVG